MIILSYDNLALWYPCPMITCLTCRCPLHQQCQRLPERGRQLRVRPEVCTDARSDHLECLSCWHFECCRSCWNWIWKYNIADRARKVTGVIQHFISRLCAKGELYNFILQGLALKTVLINIRSIWRLQLGTLQWLVICNLADYCWLLNCNMLDARMLCEILWIMNY